MNRHRVFVFGCLGAIAVIAALIAIIYYSIRGPVEAAKARWAAKGKSDYTLVVSEGCFCPFVGDVKITVHNGRVTAAEQVPTPNNPNPSPGLPPGMPLTHFDALTAEAMLLVADRAQNDRWRSPWFETLDIVYDPTYGYVTRYLSDPNGQVPRLFGQEIFDAGYSYSARDYQPGAS